MLIQKSLFLFLYLVSLFGFIMNCSENCFAQSPLKITELHDAIKTPHKFGALVIEPSLNEGTFDSHLADCPFPFYHDGKYWMTYIGWDSVGYRTGLASSNDLVKWDKEGLLIDRGSSGTATEFNVALMSIARENDLFSSGTLKKFDGKFIGTYHAYPGAGYESGPAAIGICTSTDLKKWDLQEPALRPDPNSAWEAGGLYKSWLMEHEGTWYLFYNAKDKAAEWKEQTGFATSTDLKNWTRNPGNPVLANGAAGSFDEQFASDPVVLRQKDVWVMFYFGLARDAHAREGVAFSRDLLTWEKSPTALIDIGKPDSVDSTHAHKPGIIAKDGVLYHFYCAAAPPPAQKPGEVKVVERRGISLATSSPLK